MRFASAAQIGAVFTALACGAACPRAASAFVVADRWQATASGAAGFRGDPVTLTWSLAPDGAPIAERGPSRLIQLLDGSFGSGPGGSDYTLRPWFPTIESAFDRWSALGGVTFHYEPSDDGAPQNSTPGSLGVRGDVRLSAAAGDGAGGNLASSQYPDGGDIVLDVDEAARFANPEHSYLRFRNVLMHEIGHVLGLDHLASSDVALLMEPTLTAAIDGPQLDDIRGLHYLYGDRLEKSHGGLGNDQLAHSFDLGPLGPGGSLRVGAGAGGPQVEPYQVDFLSITRASDVDYFSFDASSPAKLLLQLAPRGGQTRQAELGQAESLIDADAASDLSIALVRSDGAELALANSQPRGGTELLDGLLLDAPGRYFIRVNGTSERVQLYALALHLQPLHMPEPSASALAVGMIAAVLPGRRSISRYRSLIMTAADHPGAD